MQSYNKGLAVLFAVIVVLSSFGLMIYRTIDQVASIQENSNFEHTLDEHNGNCDEDKCYYNQ